MYHAQIAYRLIIPDPRQVRQSFRGITELAETIEEHGLLQALVVRPLGSQYMLVAGERRYRAIGDLISQDKWSGDIPCLVKDDTSAHEAAFAQLVENLQRHDVPPWDVGRRYLELIDAGYTQAEIASHTGMSVGHVSRICRIAAGLSASLVQRLKDQPKLLSFRRLEQLASLVDRETGEPNTKAQLRTFGLYLKAGVKKRKPRALGQKSPKEVCYDRFKKLQSILAVPIYAQPYVEEIVLYLDGQTKRPDWDRAYYNAKGKV